MPVQLPRVVHAEHQQRLVVEPHRAHRRRPDLDAQEEIERHAETIRDGRADHVAVADETTACPGCAARMRAIACTMRICTCGMSSPPGVPEKLR